MESMNLRADKLAGINAGHLRSQIRTMILSDEESELQVDGECVNTEIEKFEMMKERKKKLRKISI